MDPMEVETFILPKAKETTWYNGLEKKFDALRFNRRKQHMIMSVPGNSFAPPRPAKSEHTESIQNSGKNQFNKYQSQFSPLDALMPHVVAGYIQLAFNLSIVFLVLYLAITFVLSIQADIQTKVDEEIANIQSDVDECRAQFYDNRCHIQDSIVPRMKSFCESWAVCMRRDPKSTILRTRLSAQTLAEVINSFIEPISYKTLIFILSFSFAFTILSNMAFQMARIKIGDTPFEISRGSSSSTESELKPDIRNKGLLFENNQQLVPY